MDCRTPAQRAGGAPSRSPALPEGSNRLRAQGLKIAACALALGWGGAQAASVEAAGPGGDGRRFSVLLGGGMERYTGALAPLLRPGVSYGATLGYRLRGPLGVELSYSGAISEVEAGTGAGGLAPGADVTRNGAHAAVTLGLTPTRAQPYLLGGVGVERFSVRGGEALGLEDDTGAFIPAGVGLRVRLEERLTADARVTYSAPLRQSFAPHVGSTQDGRLQVLLQVGGAY